MINKDTDIIEEIEIPAIAPWALPSPTTILELTTLKKSSTSPLEYQGKFNQIRSRYPSHKFLYTDGSKDGTLTGFAVTSSKTNYCNERIPDNSSIYTAELMALLTAVRMARDSDTNKFVICSDSKSALQAINNKQVGTQLVQDILLALARMAEEKEIIFCWIPSHVDIKGNETADFHAKRSLLQNVTDYTVPYTDFRKIINDFIKYGWQIRWNAFPQNKLYKILPHVTD